MNILKQTWLWIIVFSIVVSGAIIYSSEGINIFSDREIVLRVNEEEMNRIDFQSLLAQTEDNYTQMAAMGGEELSKDELKEVAIDMAIDQLIFLSYAKRENLTISSEEKDDFYDEIVGYEEGINTKAELFSAWESEGFDRKEMEKQVKIYLLYDKIYEKFIEKAIIEEGDLEEEYQKYVVWMQESGATEDNELKSFEEMKDDLEDFILQEKALNMMEEEMKKFREESLIEILI